MESIRNLFNPDHFFQSININNSERDKQELHRSNSTINKTQRTQSTNNIKPIENDEENPETDDCFIKFGLVASSAEKNERVNDRNQKQKKSSKTQEDEEKEDIPDQPAHLVEEINAVIALIIYDTYSKKHEFTYSSQHRGKTATPSNPIRDDIDRFHAIYSCLIDQSKKGNLTSRDNKSKKYNLLNNYLRNRFFTLSDVEELKSFEQDQQSRIFEEKKANFNRVPFIPNVLSYQRTCPYYNLDDMKWIRDHLC